MGVLNAPLECYSILRNFAGDEIKYCGTLGISSYLVKLLNSLIHTEQELLMSTIISTIMSTICTIIF